MMVIEWVIPIPPAERVPRGKKTQNIQSVY